MCECNIFALAFDLYSWAALWLQDDVILRCFGWTYSRDLRETHRDWTSSSLYLLLSLCPSLSQGAKTGTYEGVRVRESKRKQEREKWDRGPILDHVCDPAACLLHNGHSNRWPCTHTQTHPHTHTEQLSLCLPLLYPFRRPQCPTTMIGQLRVWNRDREWEGLCQRSNVLEMTTLSLHFLFSSYYTFHSSTFIVTILTSVMF